MVLADPTATTGIVMKMVIPFGALEFHFLRGRKIENRARAIDDL